ncbi:MAG: SGNH/GDSL hydrolase family protein [Halioglobus sp.]|nr:SGNH/GDSL hydrolase family protein [Halioglobus sp.]
MLKQYIQNTLLVLFSVAFALLLLEAFVRTRAYLADSATIASFDNLVTRPEHGADAKLGEMIALSENENIIYRFQPDIYVRFMEQFVTINADGFRGPVVPKAKPAGIVRIVGIGDSQMFGWGVKDHETYLARMEARLTEDVPGCRWQTVNTAVPGYNTVMEVETLKVLGLDYQPDYVVVGFIGNDLQLPHFTRVQENYLSLRKSFLLGYFTQNIQSVGLKWAEPERWRPRFDTQIPEVVPEPYKHMVGKSAFAATMAELGELARAHDFEVIVVLSNDVAVPHPLDELVTNISREHGFHLLELQSLWGPYASRHGVENPDSARYLSATDPHASAPAHDAIGEGLFHLIRERSANCTNRVPATGL